MTGVGVCEDWNKEAQYIASQNTGHSGIRHPFNNKYQIGIFTLIFFLWTSLPFILSFTTLLLVPCGGLKKSPRTCILCCHISPVQISVNINELFFEKCLGFSFPTSAYTPLGRHIVFALSVCHTSFSLNNSSTLWPKAFKLHRVIALIE